MAKKDDEVQADDSWRESIEHLTGAWFIKAIWQVAWPVKDSDEANTLYGDGRWLPDLSLRLNDQEKLYVVGTFLNRYAKIYLRMVDAVATSRARPRYETLFRLNNWYDGVVKKIRFLLALPELGDFPGEFEPLAEDLLVRSDLVKAWEDGGEEQATDFVTKAGAYLSSVEEPIRAEAVEPLNQILAYCSTRCKILVDEVEAYRKADDAAAERTPPQTLNAQPQTETLHITNQVEAEKTAIDRLALDIHALLCDVPEATPYLRRMFEEARVLERFPDNSDDGESADDDEGIELWQPGNNYYNEDGRRKPVPLAIKAAWLSVIHDVQLPDEERILDRSWDCDYFRCIAMLCSGKTWPAGQVHKMDVFLKTVKTDIERTGQPQGVEDSLSPISNGQDTKIKTNTRRPPRSATKLERRIAAYYDENNKTQAEVAKQLNDLFENELVKEGRWPLSQGKLSRIIAKVNLSRKANGLPEIETSGKGEARTRNESDSVAPKVIDMGERTHKGTGLRQRGRGKQQAEDE